MEDWAYLWTPSKNTLSQAHKYWKGGKNTTQQYKANEHIFINKVKMKSLIKSLASVSNNTVYIFMVSLEIVNGM